MPDVARKAALFALGLWIMGTVCVSVVAAQNFYTIDRLIAAQTPPAFAQAVATLGATETRQVLRYVASELNRLFFQYWNYAQLPLGTIVLWLAIRLPDNRREAWLIGGMLLIVLFLTTVVTPPIIAIGRAIDFVSRNPPPPSLRTFGTLHATFTSLELTKAALGVWVAYRLSRPGPAPPRRG